MNEEHHGSPDEIDGPGEWLSPLRHAEPTPAIRRANRRAVGEALQVIEVAPWWRRTVAIPIPVAWATAACLLVATTLAFRAGGSDAAFAEKTTEPRVRVAVLSERPDTREGLWSVQHSYVGRLQAGVPDLALTTPRLGDSS